MPEVVLVPSHASVICVQESKTAKLALPSAWEGWNTLSPDNQSDHSEL